MPKFADEKSVPFFIDIVKKLNPAIKRRRPFIFNGIKSNVILLSRLFSFKSQQLALMKTSILHSTCSFSCFSGPHIFTT